MFTGQLIQKPAYETAETFIYCPHSKIKVSKYVCMCVCVKRLCMSCAL